MPLYAARCISLQAIERNPALKFLFALGSAFAIHSSDVRSRVHSSRPGWIGGLRARAQRRLATEIVLEIPWIFSACRKHPRTPPARLGRDLHHIRRRFLGPLDERVLEATTLGYLFRQAMALFLGLERRAELFPCLSPRDSLPDYADHRNNARGPLGSLCLPAIDDTGSLLARIYILGASGSADSLHG